MLEATSELTRLAPYLELFMDGDVAVVRLTEDAIELGLDLPAHEALRGLMRTLASSPEPRAVLILANKLCFSPQRCDRLFKKLGAVPSGSAPETWIPREENAARTLIEGLLKIPVPVVVALEGTVDLMAFGPVLAADRCLIDSEAVLVSRCHQLGIPPGLGLLYLLPLCVGLLRSRRILMRDFSATAEDVREMGLVDEVVADDDFESRARKTARDLSRLSLPVVRSMKRLLLEHLPDLGEHFTLECKCIEAAIRKIRAGGDEERQE